MTKSKKTSMMDNFQRSYILDLKSKVQDKVRTIYTMEAILFHLEQRHQSIPNTSETNSNSCNCHTLYNGIHTNSPLQTSKSLQLPISVLE